MVAPQEDRAALASQAHYDAGLRFRSGDLVRAAQLIRLAAGLDPARSRLWTTRQARIAEASSRQPLAVQTAVRLATAGLTPKDPGLSRITDWNGRARHQAAEREAS